MRHIDAIPSKPPVRRICADFHKEAAVEVDMLEVQIGINRAAMNKTEHAELCIFLSVNSVLPRLAGRCGGSGRFGAMLLKKECKPHGDASRNEPSGGSLCGVA